MKNIVIYSALGLLTCFLLIACCKKERDESPLAGDGMLYMAVKVNSLGNENAEDENSIYKIRTIVTGEGGIVISNELHTTSSPSDASHTVGVKANFGSGYTIYTICNEADDLIGKLSNVTTESLIEQLQYSVQNIKCPLMMFGKQSGLTIQINPDTKEIEVLKDGALWNNPTIDVRRTMVKLSFTAIKNAPLDDLFSVEEMSYSVCQVPKYGFLQEKELEYYNPIYGWAGNIDVGCTGKLSLNNNDSRYEINGKDVTVVGESITSPTIYLPEHLVNPEYAENSDYCTYLLVSAKCKRGENSPIFNINYRINLGANPPIDHNLKRNYNYRVYATITGISTIGFHAKIIPMTEYNVPITWSPFEGYTIMGECETERGTNILNNFSQYSGILRISKSGNYYDALFRYGSIVALSSTTAATNFDVSKDVLWKLEAVQSPITSWSSIKYQPEGADVEHTLDNIKQGKGDPCRLIGLTNSEITSGIYDNNQWRMATSDEMQYLNIAKNDTRKADGFYSYNYLLTPYTGYREGGAGKMVVSNKNGYYWSSTASNAFVFNNIDGEDGTISPAAPQHAYAIRCVRTTVQPSRISAVDAYADYNGATDLVVEIAENFLVPYWKIKLDNDLDASNISFSKDQGTYDQSAICTVQPSAMPYQRNYYFAKVTGYGLDGVVHTKPVTIHQLPLKHTITLKISSDVALTERNGYIRVPQKGATFTIEMDISPRAIPPYADDFDSMKWYATLVYYNNQKNEIIGTEVTTQNPSVLVIPENHWNNTVTLNISMSPKVKEEFPPYTTPTLVYLQDYTQN